MRAAHISEKDWIIDKKGNVSIPRCLYYPLFPQFEDGILDICLKILDMGASYHHGSDRDHCWRNDPVHVSMVVNHMVRSVGV